MIKLLKKERLSPSMIVVGLIALLAIIVCIVFLLNRQNVKKVGSLDELKAKTNITMIDPQGATDIVYQVEKDKIASIGYRKDTFSGANMTFTLKTSYALEDLDVPGMTWGTPIVMTTYCDDGNDIEVISYLSANNPKVMKGNWFDNDMYYMMVTDSLTTREDFLQEVNKVILSNHVSFEE